MTDTIYASPWKNPKEPCTGPSVPSGFSSIEDVITCCGTAYLRRGAGHVVYPGVVYSVIPWSYTIDEPDNSGQSVKDEPTGEDDERKPPD